jgi:hypothetical protein
MPSVGAARRVRPMREAAVWCLDANSREALVYGARCTAYDGVSERGAIIRPHTHRDAPAAPRTRMEPGALGRGRVNVSPYHTLGNV